MPGIHRETGRWNINLPIIITIFGVFIIIKRTHTLYMGVLFFFCSSYPIITTMHVYAHTRCIWWCACVTVYMNVVIYLLETKQWQRGGSSRFLCVPQPLSTARVYFFFPSQPTDVLLLKKIFIFDFFLRLRAYFYCSLVRRCLFGRLLYVAH